MPDLIRHPVQFWISAGVYPRESGGGNDDVEIYYCRSNTLKKDGRLCLNENTIKGYMKILMRMSIGYT
jgi:hypothetical protein